MNKVVVSSRSAATARPTHVVRGREGPAAPRPRIARTLLLLVWLGIVAAPWLLQLRSFSKLAVRHKITQNLIPSPNATPVTTAAGVMARCPVFGMLLAGVWYDTYPSHYFETEGVANSPAICHFVMPQYNSHGVFMVQNHKTEPTASTPTKCANDSYPVNFFFYHGSISYYALYSEGVGSYCSLDSTMYTVTTAIGSSDMNFNTLAKYTATSGYHSSVVFGCIGGLWLTYRAIVLTRSFRSCSRYGRRLDSLKEPIAISDAVVYVQQAARLAPHSATNWHRLVLLYLLAEGLMTDLFMVIAQEGIGTKVQYVSLGYNIAGLLSMLFEIVEHTKWLSPPSRLLVKRLLFNTESSIWGELLFSVAMAYYVTGLNRSDLGPTRKVAEAMSFYAWGLVNHGIIVLSQATFILTVRAIVTLVYVAHRFRSLRMLTTPCCVDSIMGSRYKLATISGYEFNNSTLYYAKETIKAHGLLKVVADDGKEYLVYHKIHWLPTAHEDLTVVGHLVREHVKPCAESLYSGPVAVCDRMLGGLVEEWERGSDWDDNEELESGRRGPVH